MSERTSDDSDNYGTAVEFSGDETQENLRRKESRYRRKSVAKERGITDKQFRKEREQRQEQSESKQQEEDNTDKEEIDIQIIQNIEYIEQD